MSMKNGDAVYFFIKRKIYGIGHLINLSFDCKFLNYPHADEPTIPDYNKIRATMLLDSKDNLNNRCICTFVPSPYFFANGIDIDDILSFRPNSFKMLRAFWKLSFIKIDDEENLALHDIILKRNESYLLNTSSNYSFDNSLHNIIRTKIQPSYKLSSNTILEICSQKTKLKHEMALELGLIELLSTNSNTIFGNWDYISHQVVSSPFKPIDYMDKMDIFGYRYIHGFSTISQYLIMELKKDTATKDTVDQIMKYVDWVNKEYAFNDYSMITAFIVAASFNPDVISYAKEVGIRNFTKGIRPTLSEIWTNITLVKYSYLNGELTFELILN